MNLENRRVKKLYSLMLITAVFFSTIVTVPSITTAASKSATWTTKGDFENNASTTLSATSRNNVDVSGTLPNDNANVALSGNYGLLGSNFAVSTATNGQYPSSIAYNPSSNQFMVTWQDWRSGSNYDVYAQRINANGTLAGSEIAVSTANDSQVFPSIAYNPSSNQFMVAWQDNRSILSNDDIYAQRINVDGTLNGSNFAVSTAVESQGSPSIAYNSTSNQFMVTWQDRRNASNSDIYAQRINADGNLAGTNFAIATGPSNQSGPSIAYNSASNQFMIAWDIYNAIYAQRVNADGTLAGSEEIAVSTATEEKGSPSIAYNSTSDQFMVTWDDWRNGPNSDVYAQRINADGTLAGSNFAITTAGGPSSIAYNPTSNQFMVAWEDYRAGGWGDIYAQIINADGSLTGAQIGVSTEISYQGSPLIAYNSTSNQFMIGWEDSRNGSSSDIYAQRVGVVNYPLSGTLSGLKINAGTKAKWSAISWNGITPANTAIKFRTRGADSEAGLASASWSGYYTTSGSAITTPDSQWLEIEATLESTDGVQTPTLNDFTVNYDVISTAQVQNPINMLSTSLSLSAKPKVIKKGKATTIKGQLKDANGKPVVGKKVVLKQKVLKKIKKKVRGKIKIVKKWIWKKIVTLTTNSKGIFAKKIKPKATTIFKAEFSGDSGYKAANSKAVKVTVKKAKKKKK